VLEALEGQLAERRFQRAGQEPGQLDDRHAEVLPRAARQAAAVARCQLGKGLGDVGQHDAAPAGQRQRGEVAEPAADGEGQRRRQPRGGGGQPAREGYAERRRSRTSSTTIGISESTITIRTTMWM
jgi:hypothetical protein